MNPMKENLEIVDDIMDRVTQTDFWNNIQLTNPMIQEADEQLEAQLTQLDGIISNRQIDEIRSHAWYLVNAFTYPAILYGMRVTQAIQEVALDPNSLSQYIMDRVAKLRGGDNPCGCSLAPSQQQNKP